MSRSAVDDEPITVGERYASATRSSNLLPKFLGVTDADVLLAAGMAAHGDERLRLALTLWRMRVNSDSDGLWDVVANLDQWLLRFLARKGNRPMAKEARRALLGDVLSWWLKPTCTYCEGRAFLVVPDTPRLSTVACEGCHGTGQRQLARCVPHAHVRHARWLTSEMDRLASVVHGRMAKLLSNRMDL